MPWKNTTAMDQKVEFICDWMSERYTLTDLCEFYAISRPSGYRLIQRYEQHGIKGLTEQSRAPFHHPNSTRAEVVDRILSLKEAHPRWGAKKLRALLNSDFSDEEIPSVITVHSILKRNGLVYPQKRRRRVKPVFPIFDPQECNQVWSADYKGKLRMRSMEYCHPLTIADSRSRFLFTAKAHRHEDYESVKGELTRVFRKYGMPLQVHTDNGAPFGAVNSIQRFTKLSYWLIELGILPVFSDPAHPEQNGRHERMHRELKAACAQPTSYSMETQQRRLSAFVKEYNYVRPHEALGMETPAKVHQWSERAFPEVIKEWVYPSDVKALYVTRNGAIRWKSFYRVYMTRGLVGKWVGAEEVGNGIWKIFYRDVLLGYFSEKAIMDKESLTRLSTNLV